MNVLYVTPDGITSPLGYSQIVRPILGLADRGYDYDLVSVERNRDLERFDHFRRLEKRLGRHGIEWDTVEFRAGGTAMDAASMLVRLVAKVLARASEDEYDLLHFRSYHPGPAALAADLMYDLPYLLDNRGYWIDERIDEGRWFHNDAVLQIAREIESWIYRRSTAVVSLTEIAADDIRRGTFCDWSGDQPVVTIPTCVDYASFSLEYRTGERNRDAVPDSMEETLEECLTVGYIGAINASYRVDDSLRLCRKIFERRDDVRLVCLTRQDEEMDERLEAHGISRDRVFVTEVEHRDIPQWMSLLDWGLLLLNTTRAKRASMPTKLAEYFATGVRPIHHGCNEEVGKWVQRTGTGLSLESTREESLEEAATNIAETGPSDPTAIRELREGREEARDHFALQSGIDRYEELLDTLSERFHT